MVIKSFIKIFFQDDEKSKKHKKKSKDKDGEKKKKKKKKERDELEDFLEGSPERNFDEAYEAI